MQDPWDDEDPLDEEEPTAEEFFQTALLFEGGLAILALVLGWAFSQSPVAGLDFLSQSNQQIVWSVVWGLVATIPLVVGFWLIDRFGQRWFADLDEVMSKSIGPMFAGIDLPGLLLVSLAAGVGEEMLFRGFLQGILAGSMTEPYGPWVAVALAAIVFGYCHYFSLNYFLLATFMGAYMGAIWIWSGSLLTPIVTHATYDFLALWFITRFKDEETEEAP